MAKIAFSRSDVIAITHRMTDGAAAHAAPVREHTSAALSRAPASPVAAKVMREVGVSSKKMSEAYRLARTAAIKAE
jgi:hypothetical protein